MRGSIVKRSKFSWALVVPAGRDPATGKRKQKWVKFDVPRNVGLREATKQAEAKLAELLHQIDKGTYVDTSKLTLIEHLRDWHAKVTPHRRPETVRVYRTMIERHVAKASIATMPIQKLRASDLEAFYGTLKLSPVSVKIVHAVLSASLKMALRDQRIATNPAAAATHRPRSSKDKSKDAREHCWNAEEARKVLTAAKEDGAEMSALVSFLLDTGVRKSEALGLQWSHVDLDAGTATIAQQLEPRCAERPRFGPTKTGRSRTITLGAETIIRLRTHRKQQRELMMANRTTYKDHDLVFAKEDADLQRPTAALGQPCLALVDRHFKRVVKAAGVKLIKPHGTRHTCATLLLSAGVPVQVVADRLGHASIVQTLETYAHALPDMQRDAATRLGAVLTGA